MRPPPTRLLAVVNNLVIALLVAALAVGGEPELLWWPLNTDAFLWITCGVSVAAAVTAVLAAAVERLTD